VNNILSKIGLSVLGDGPMYDNRPVISKRRFDLFYTLEELINPKIILEVGSWEGRSTLSWAEIAKRNNGVVICVDTWLGSTEHYENLLPNSEWERNRLFLEDGYPSIYKTFVTNVRAYHYQDHVIALPLDSHQAFILIERLKINPDITYVDASHDYDSVLSDLRAAQRVNSKIICGDDYHYMDDQVKRAVDDFAKENNMFVVEKQSQFILLAQSQLSVYNTLIEREWNTPLEER
jgi:hypothetical protein